MEKYLENLPWPIVVLTMALLFRKKLGDLISRITSVGKQGIEVSPPVLAEVQREEKRDNPGSNLLISNSGKLVLAEIEERIKADSISQGHSVEGKTQEFLIQHLAATQLLLECEQVHSLIFGSQISLLKALNQLIGQGISSQNIEKYFQETQARFPDEFTDWTADQYLIFLFARNLIVENDGSIHLSNLGVEFLSWMARVGKSELRPL